MSGKRKKPDDDRPRTPTLLNARARREFEAIEKFEAGILLRGAEVKSLREGNASLAEAYARFKGDELFLLGFHIGQYRHRSAEVLEPTRPRKLLLRRQELTRLSQAVQRKGLTIVPLRLFWSERNLAKVEIALARGRRLHDKRLVEKERSAKREMDRARSGRSG